MTSRARRSPSRRCGFCIASRDPCDALCVRFCVLSVCLAGAQDIDDEEEEEEEAGAAGGSAKRPRTQ